jgi:hypothetical protein
MRIFLVLFLLFGVFPVLAQTDQGQAVAPAPPTSDSKPQEKDTPEEREYKAKLAEISRKIAEKITEIQNKQRDIDNEIFPPYIPPMQLEKKALTDQLNDLQMERNQLESQKKVKDLQKQLSKP